MENKRELLINVLEGKEVDRIPVAPFIFNNFIHKYYKAANPFSTYLTDKAVDAVERGIELYEQFGFDIILRTANIWGSLNENYCNTENWIVNDEKNGNELQWEIKTTIRTPEKVLTQIKKFARNTKYEVVEALNELFIKDENDFEQFIKFQPPLPEYDSSDITRAKKLLNNKGLVAPWAQGAFNITSFHRKVDELLMDAYTNHDFYDRMMKYFAKRHLSFIRQLVNAGADIICCGGNVANATMAGPDFFRQFVLPYEIDFAESVKDMGTYYLYHNCGNASSLFELYNEIGMNIYETLSEPPYGDTNLEDAMKRFDKRITLSGNIDHVDFLARATPKEIKQQVKKVLNIVKKRGNFILAATDYFEESIPYDNIMAFADAAREYGNY
jgi:uroporphyrinogen decarboxylase